MDCNEEQAEKSINRGRLEDVYYVNASCRVYLVWFDSEISISCTSMGYLIQNQMQELCFAACFISHCIWHYHLPALVVLCEGHANR